MYYDSRGKPFLIDFFDFNLFVISHLILYLFFSLSRFDDIDPENELIFFINFEYKYYNIQYIHFNHRR